MPRRSRPGSRRCASASGSSTPSARSPGPQAVLAYLSRYTHRVAISNSRLVALDERGVTFRWKDYRAKGGHAPQDDDARRRRVHAPLPAARAARRLPSHPPLRAAGQRQPQGQPARRRVRCWAVRAKRTIAPADAPQRASHATPDPPSCAGTAARRCIVLQTFGATQPIRAPPGQRVRQHECTTSPASTAAELASSASSGRGHVFADGAPLVRRCSWSANLRAASACDADGPTGPPHPRWGTAACRSRHYRHSAVAPSDHRGVRRGFLPRGLSNTCPQIGVSAAPPSARRAGVEQT